VVPEHLTVRGRTQPDPSVGRLGESITDRAAGNPFFAEEMVRELAERGVLRGLAKARSIRSARICRPTFETAKGN
jgi:hypothetical protein